MRFSVTAIDGASGRSVDVLLDALPEQRVSDILPALLGVLGEPVHPRFLSGLVVYVDGHTVAVDQTLRDAGLRPGARIALHEPDAWQPGLPTGVVELRVVSGPGAGRIHRIGLGEHVIGCGASGMSLPDLLLPDNALTVAVDTDGELTIVEATVAVRIDGEDPNAPDEVVLDDPAEDVDNLPEELLTRRERAARHRRDAHTEIRPTVLDWPRGADLRIGQTVLQWQHVWQPDADVSVSTERLGLDFNRPPRMLPPVRESSFVIPAEPAAPRAQRIPWAMVLAPVVMAGPMALLFGSPRYLVLAALSPVMALFNWVLNRRGNAQDHRQRMIEYKTEDRSVRRRIARAWTLERDDVRGEQPDAAELLLQAVGPGQLLWVRRRRDPDYLTLRVGVADRPSSIAIRDRARKETDEPRPPHALGDVPVGVRMRQEGVLGLCGDGAGVDALSRWMLGQAAVLHSPDDLRIVVLTGADREEQWDWLRWLPHCRANDEPVGAFVGTEQSSVSRRVGELGQILAARGKGDSLTTQGDIPPRPDFLVVLDGARRLRTLPGVVQLLRQGPAAGIHVICLDEDARSLPEECRAVLQVSEGLVEFRRTGSEAVSRISPDLVEQAWSERIGRALAPVRDTTPDEQVSGLPASARLLDSVRMPDPTPDQIRHRWGPQAQTEVVIGEGFDGPFRLDLRKDGPHALIAGTTGSGKSEFLQTVVASLAIANSPEQMTFVLVDYKGGSAFKDCARLPHTVGMVTDLDTHLVGRALTSLGAELRRREHLLAVPGAKDLEDYWALQRSDPSLPVIPRLAIVIDEFASLKSELPEFVDGLVTIAQRGRSLGIHLVLATQRPSGVISNDIRANTNLRIALRVTDEAESRDVIDAPDAATIGASQPGRGYARLGHSSLLPFQSGRVGGACPSARTDVAELPPALAWPLPWSALGMPAPARPKAEGGGTDEGETDLKVLVEAIQGANDDLRLAPMHSPWLPSLPPVVTVAGLRSGEAAPEAGSTDADRIVGFSAPWAVDDVPADQAQRPRRFVLGGSGHLFVVGGARSGRSTALRTIAAALAESTPARDLHLYGLDCGNGALLPLTALPHTGAVVQRTEVERAGRLLDRLLEEVKRRQDVLGRDGFADIDEQRRAAEPDERLPYVLLLLDRWEGFVSDLAEVDLGRLNDAMLTLLREGASVGVQVLVTGDRLLLSGRVAGLVESKLLLRLPDRTDYSLAGLKVRDVPENLAEGRGMWAESGLESQIAVLADDVSGAAQSAYVRELGARLRETGPVVPPGLRPFSLAALPSEVTAESVLSASPVVAPGTVPVGVGGDGLDLLGVEAVQSPALVVGPPRSGRTNSLLFAARWAAAQDRQILGFTPAENALTTALAELGAECVAGTSAGPDEVVKRLQELRDGALVLIDDAERLRDADMAPVLMALVRQARDRDFHVLVAGGTAELAAGYSGWITEARKGRKGVVLSPMEALAGDVFGGRVGRMSILPRLTPGRGVLFDGTGDQIPLQTPRCE